MTVSRLGSPLSPYSHVATPLRRVRPVERPAARNDFDSLTAADRELIFQVTGQRVTAGFDPQRQPPSAFAALLAAERSSGHLAPGQEVTAVYLKDLDRRYTRGAGPNPVRPYLEKAVDHLARTGVRRIDVSA
jgi:hypothetical protein